MLDTIVKFDQQILLLVNNLPHPILLVLIAIILSEIQEFGMIWLIIAAFLVYFKKNHPRIILELLIVLVGTYYLVQGVIKPLVERLRPEFVLKQIKVYAQTDNDYFSFPSGHAATAFAAAIVLSRIFPKGSSLFYLLATLIAISRVYLGVHYPLDVLGGALLGIVTGMLAVRLINIKPTKHLKTVLLFVPLFLLSTKSSFAKMVMSINPNSVSIYEESQVLGVSSDDTNEVSAVVGKLISITTSEGKLRIGLGENSQNGKQEVDQLFVKSDKNNLNIISEKGKLVIKEKLAQASTDLPLIIEQSTGKIIADTGLGKKVLKLLPMDVINGLKINLPVTFELKENAAKLEYVVNQTKQKKILGIIPVSANITTTVSAETGEITNKFTPWIGKFLF